ncbi:hypothetical protein D9M71_719930 [compost metagenome]
MGKATAIQVRQVVFYQGIVIGTVAAISGHRQVMAKDVGVRIDARKRHGHQELPLLIFVRGHGVMHSRPNSYR